MVSKSLIDPALGNPQPLDERALTENFAPVVHAIYKMRLPEWFEQMSALCACGMSPAEMNVPQGQAHLLRMAVNLLDAARNYSLHLLNSHKKSAAAPRGKISTSARKATTIQSRAAIAADQAKQSTWVTYAISANVEAAAALALEAARESSGLASAWSRRSPTGGSKAHTAGDGLRHLDLCIEDWEKPASILVAEADLVRLIRNQAAAKLAKSRRTRPESAPAPANDASKSALNSNG